jgi:uncharacterized protein (TIGR00255 family)
MTGYGHASNESPWGYFDVTVKSLNNRFCSINTHLPDLFESFEIKIQELIKGYINRGRIEYRLNWEPSEGFAPRPVINGMIVESYVENLKQIAEKYHLAGNVSLEMISHLPGIFSFEKGGTPPIEDMWSPISNTTVGALKYLVDMREREGEAIKLSIADMLKSIKKIQGTIEDLVPGRIEKAKKRVQERVEEVLKGKEVDETRVLMEVTLLADKWDISEELTRVKSHIIQLERAIDSDGTVGRRMSFLLQELLREVNTITSKAYDAEISHRAVGIKEIIEQIREQVENIE